MLIDLHWLWCYFCLILLTLVYQCVRRFVVNFLKKSRIKIWRVCGKCVPLHPLSETKRAPRRRPRTSPLGGGNARGRVPVRRFEKKSCEKICRFGKFAVTLQSFSDGGFPEGFPATRKREHIDSFAITKTK